MPIRTVHFMHNDEKYYLEIDDFGDDESSDGVEVFDASGNSLTSYDSCVHTDAVRITQAIEQLD